MRAEPARRGGAETNVRNLNRADGGWYFVEKRYRIAREEPRRQISIAGIDRKDGFAQGMQYGW